MPPSVRAASFASHQRARRTRRSPAFWGTEAAVAQLLYPPELGLEPVWDGAATPPPALSRGEPNISLHKPQVELWSSDPRRASPFCLPTARPTAPAAT